MNVTRKLAIVLSLAMTGLLVACGGGGGSSPAPTTACTGVAVGTPGCAGVTGFNGSLMIPQGRVNILFTNNKQTLSHWAMDAGLCGASQAQAMQNAGMPGGTPPSILPPVSSVPRPPGAGPAGGPGQFDCLELMNGVLTFRMDPTAVDQGAPYPQNPAGGQVLGTARWHFLTLTDRFGNLAHTPAKTATITRVAGGFSLRNGVTVISGAMLSARQMTITVSYVSRQGYYNIGTGTLSF